MKKKYLLILSVLLASASCVNNKNNDPAKNAKSESQIESSEHKKVLPLRITVTKDVPISSYFKWMDSIVAKHNESHNYAIDEYLIVHHNKWIIDTLAHTDYYYLMDKGIFNEDSKSLIALKKEQILVIPDSMQTVLLKAQLSNTYLELNIPEFRLRIIQDEKVIYKFPVRVGKNSSRYLAMAKREVDMRTEPGIGEIIRVNKSPIFMNPKNNRRYYTTSRDDGKRTALPAIPWLEPAVNGRSVGQLIHPTTNLNTLEKASSNGCIGLRESDSWIVYYYAPLGTKVIFKYDLEGKNEDGELIKFKNIYPGFENIKISNVSESAAIKYNEHLPICNCMV